MTVPVSAEISVVMSEDNARPDGVTEATRRGAESHARKNKNASEALFVIACLFQDPGAPNIVAEGAIPRR